MYKLVASDMDETFLDGEHRIPEANIRALRRMRELGVLFVPSSGRPYDSIMDNFRDVDQDLLEGTYVLSYNGGFINRYGDPDPILTTTIDRDIIEALYRHGVEHRIPMHIYTPSGKIFTQFLMPEEREYVKGIVGVVELDDEQDTLDFAGDEPFVKILYVAMGLDAVKELGEEVRPLLDPDRVQITYSSDRYVEFVPAGIDKGTGLAHLAEMLGIDMSETIGVGDSANDLAMIEAAGLGVGVANVSDDARPHCDLVLDTPASEGAFLELVERVLEAQRA